MKPFCAFDYEHLKFRTKPDKDGGKNPHWHEVL